MAEEAVDEAIKQFFLIPGAKVSKGKVKAPRGEGVVAIDGQCQTDKLKLVGAHSYSKTLFINLIQHFGVAAEFPQRLAGEYGNRAWQAAQLLEPARDYMRLPEKRLGVTRKEVEASAVGKWGAEESRVLGAGSINRRSSSPPPLTICITSSEFCGTARISLDPISGLV
ncbi:mitochondrial glycerol-3-phosphate dehydrogenase [Rhizina undulata]